MKKFNVILSRTYEIEVEGNNIDDVKKYVEFYIGDCKDEATEEDRKECGIKINNINCVWNEVTSICDEEKDEILELI
jgi:hypothetical protein